MDRSDGRLLFGLKSQLLTSAKNASSVRGSLTLMAFTAAVLLAAGCGGGSSASTVTTPPPVIAVSVAAAASSVEAGGTVAVTATLVNDSAGQGVTFSVSPAGSGTFSNVTSTTATYNAPATPPATDLAVAITATSKDDGTKSATTTIVVPAITVGATTDTGSVEAGGVAHLMATVGHDPANRGVTWSISPATGAGTLSNATSTSVTYTAPATVPASNVAVFITATSVTDTTKANEVEVDYAAIFVNLGVNTSTLEAGASTDLTATVSNDPANQGVTWSLSPATGAGMLSNTTASGATYNAPATAPASDLTVAITATSISDNTKSSSVSLTVPAITAKVEPNTALVPLNATVQFTPTVANDPASQGVTWDVRQSGTSCQGPCGAIAPASTASGAASTYTAPGSMPANATVNPTATSVSDTTKSAAATVTLTSGSVELVPASLNFGSIKPSGSKQLLVDVTNTGGAALKVTGMTIAGGMGSFTESDTCQPTVAAGATCVITVKFAPKAATTFSGSLSIADSSSDSPQVVALSGVGIPRFRGPLVSGALGASAVNEVPRPSGALVVGTRVVDLVDATREDPYTGDGSKRELLVRMWYPTVSGQACRAAAYALPRVWSYFSKLVGVPLAEIHTNSCADATVAEGEHAVVVFSPGYTATFTDYTFLFEDLASRGYVVASIDHTHEATALEFPDGRFVVSAVGSHLNGVMRAELGDLEFAESVRLADVKFVAGALAAMNGEAGGAFGGKLDTTKIALAGHSLGGWTAIEAVSGASLFKVGVALDASVPPGAAIATEKPMLIVGMGRDVWSDDEKAVWAGLRGPRFALNVPAADHCAPSDAVWLARYAIATGAMSPAKMIATVREYLAAFLDANLRGEESGELLRGRSARFAEVVVTTRGEALRGKN